MNKKYEDMAPCGVFCGACPSYHKSCKGCASDDKIQIRKSKWGCKIRTCCYDQKKIDYCIYCSQFPCDAFSEKLLSKHFHDPKFTYRHEIPAVFEKLKELGIDEFHKFQVQRWKCLCGGTIQFYDYRCKKCGAERLVSYV